MDPMTFTLLYITVVYATVALVWILTSPLRLVRVGSISTRILQASINSTHLLSGIFFPLPVPFDIPIRSLGLAILTLGAIFAVWAKLTMKDEWGLPGTHDSLRQTRLVTHGPFRYSRNPIYLGIILMSFGMSIAMRSAFIFLVFFLYNFLYGQANKEESSLVKQFGSTYIEYSSHTPKFM